MIIETSTLASLIAMLLRERRTAAGETDAQAFKDWLENTAFPEIIERSEEILTVLDSASTSQGQKLDSILARIEELFDSLGLRSPTTLWNALKPVDRELLLHLYAEAIKNDLIPFTIDELASSLNKEPEDLKIAAKRLKERDIARIPEFTGADCVGISSYGLLTAWRNDSNRDAALEVRRISEELVRLDKASSIRVGELAQSVGIESILVHEYCRCLGQKTLISFTNGYGHPEQSLIHSPSQLFIDNPPTLDSLLIESV